MTDCVLARPAHVAALVLGGLLATLSSCGLDRTLLSDRPDAGAAGSAGSSPSDAGAVGIAGSSPSDDAGTAAGAGDSGATAIAFDVSEYGSCAASKGTVSCWGGSSDSPTTSTYALSPVPRAVPEALRTLEAGANHFCGVAVSGAVYCWGSNGSFELGSPNASEAGPIRVGLPSGARAVSSGGAHTCAILTDSTLWCWGANLESQLGQADSSLGARVADPIQVGVANDWLAIALGDAHSCGIRNGGQLWCWGRNNAAQLGLGYVVPGQLASPTQVGSSDTWVALACSQEGGCGLQRDGSAWCWGGNISGRVGGALQDPVLTPQQVTTRHDFTEIDTGTFHSCARTALGDLWCWGRNVEGQLGLGTFTAQEPPTELGALDWSRVRVGRFHTCALRADGSLWCAGKNDVGQLGIGDTMRRANFASVPAP